MKKIIVLVVAGLISAGLYASENKVAQVDSTVEGRLTMLVDLGQRVKKGQLLFYVATATEKLQLQKDLNGVGYNKYIYDRDRKLLKTHSVSLADFQEARYNLITAIQAARGAEIGIQNSCYYAPFDGIVTKIINYSGSGVGDGNEVVDITKLSKNEAENKALEKQILESPKVAQVDSMDKGIETLLVHQGQYVKKGQPLFYVNTVPKVNDATTYILPQKVKYENAIRYYREIYERDKKLLKTHSVSLADFQEARYNLVDAVLDLKIHEENIRESFYYAPFDGIVTSVLKYDGANLGDGGENVDVTAVTPHTDVKALELTAKKAPVVAQIASINEKPVHILVKLGQHVKKGQLLLYTDVQALEAQKLQDENNVRYDKEQYDRQKKLSETHSVALADFQEARYNLINAMADYTTTKLNIKYSYYYAPFDGVITKVVNYDGSGIGDGHEIVDVTKS